MSIQVILTAAVPVIKLEVDGTKLENNGLKLDKSLTKKDKNINKKEYIITHIKVDLSIENGKEHLGIISFNLMNQWLAFYPGLFTTAVLMK